jgi:hypothetical protein
MCVNRHDERHRALRRRSMQEEKCQGSAAGLALPYCAVVRAHARREGVLYRAKADGRRAANLDAARK